MMGVWFLARRSGNLIAGIVGGSVNPENLEQTPTLFTLTTGVTGHRGRRARAADRLRSGSMMVAKLSAISRQLSARTIGRHAKSELLQSCWLEADS